jgi:Holliday junction resolvase
MITEPRRRCCKEGCRVIATHRLNSDRYCEDHAPANAVDFAQRECQSCKLICILDADNLCASCCGPAKIRTKVKENAVRDILLAHGIPIAAQDRMLNGGECVRSRPDFVIYVGTHIVIVECDENAHRSYVKACEVARMINLSQAAEGLGVIFIRYNPDPWKTADGKPGKATPQRRIKTLIDWVKRAMSPESNPAVTGAFCSVKYLFYDGYDVDDKSTEFETLLKV